MAESDVISYLATQCSLVVGTSLFCGSIPETLKSGIALRTVQEVDISENLEDDAMAVIVVDYDYTTGDTAAIAIKTALESRRGLSENSWTTIGNVIKTYVGVDDLRRNVFEIQFQVRHYK